LKEKDVEFHFVFVGKRMEQIPHLHDDCVRYCRENELSRSVSFLGSRTDVPDILVELDAFLYATDHDTFGIAVVEALAVGVPVFVNDWEVMNEITENGKFATIYKTKDVDDLLQQFMLFLQNKQGYLTKANEAAGFVRTNYSIEKHIEKLKKVYESSEYKALSKE
jgi:glycosyltransferase involved in cell wall biosynthesis